MAALLIHELIRLDRVALIYLRLLELHFIKSGVEAVLGDQFPVGAAFDNSPIMHDRDQIGVANG